MIKGHTIGLVIYTLWLVHVFHSKDILETPWSRGKKRPNESLGDLNSLVFTCFHHLSISFTHSNHRPPPFSPSPSCPQQLWDIPRCLRSSERFIVAMASSFCFSKSALEAWYSASKSSNSSKFSRRMGMGQPTAGRGPQMATRFCEYRWV